MTEKDPVVLDPLTCVLGFIRALEAGGGAEDIRPFLAEDFVLVEAPHVLAPRGSTKTLEAVLSGAENSGEVVAGQRFEVNRTTCEGGRVVIEADWSATLRMDLPYWDTGAYHQGQDHLRVRGQRRPDPQPGQLRLLFHRRLNSAARRPFNAW